MTGVTWIKGVVGCCEYCGAPFDDACHHTGATRDHVVPKDVLSGGLGGSAYSPLVGNIVLACGLCNQMKRNLLPEGMREIADAQEARTARLRMIADRAEQIIKERKLL